MLRLYLVLGMEMVGMLMKNKRDGLATISLLCLTDKRPQEG